MFSNFTKRGANLKPVQPACWYPNPVERNGGYTHGVYNPILRVGDKRPNEAMPVFPIPAKPRGTI